MQTLGDGTCIASLAESKAKRAELFARVFQDKFHQCDGAEKLCAQDLPSGVQPLADGTCIASFAGSHTKNVQLLARVFQDKFHQYDCSKNCAPKTCQSFQTLGWVWWRAWSPLVARDAAALCVAGVALGDMDILFAWQAWRLATLTFYLRGRRGAWRH